MYDVDFVLISDFIRYRAEIGIVPESPLLNGTNGEIRPKGEMVFVIGRERLDVVAEIANRIRPHQDRFAFYDPLFHGSFISRRNSTTENGRIGPASERLHIGRQPV